MGAQELKQRKKEQPATQKAVVEKKTQIKKVFKHIEQDFHDEITLGIFLRLTCIAFVTTFVIAVASAFGLWLFFTLTAKPSSHREWAPLYNKTSYAEFRLPYVDVFNIRNFTFDNFLDEHQFTASYYDKTFDVTKLKGMAYMVHEYSTWNGGAHVWLSFEFEGNEFLDVSVEARAKNGEEVSLLKGCFNNYELAYVFVDEMDIIKLRGLARDESVMIFPGNVTSTEDVKQVFLDMMRRANKLKEEPEWYNTFLNSCIMNVVKHVNKLHPNLISPRSLRVLLSGYSSNLAYDLGLIQHSYNSYDEMHKAHKVNYRAMKYRNDNANFSKMIRQWGVLPN